MYMAPSVEDVNDGEDEQNKQEQGLSENELSPLEVTEQPEPSPTPSKNKEERQKSSSSRPKTASTTRSHTDNEEAKSSRASSGTSSDDTSALLRSDNDNSRNVSDDEVDNQEEQLPVRTSIKSGRTNSNVSDALNGGDKGNLLSQPIDKSLQRNIKGEYDASQVIQLKESFQPIINEAASYGHIDVVRKLIEVS
jgi:hypothetical protein